MDEGLSREKGTDSISNSNNDSTTGFEASSGSGAHPNQCSNIKPLVDTELMSSESSCNKNKAELVAKGNNNSDVNRQCQSSSLCPSSTATSTSSSTKPSDDEVSNSNSSWSPGIRRSKQSHS